MKIVLVMDQFDNESNGTTVTARRLAENLRAEGHSVTILAGGKEMEGKIRAEKRRIPFFQGLIESQGMCFAKPDPELYYEAFHDADIVHFFMPFSFCSQGEKHARQMKKPCVAGFHIQPENITSTLHLENSDRINKMLYNQFNRRFYKRFTHIHCPSDFIAEQLHENGYSAQTHVISNGVARDFVPIETQKPPEWEGKYVILMIGRFSREKRQDLLIEAAAQSKYADKIQLVFAGKGPEATNYEKLGRMLKNKPEMRFMPQEELLRVINCADLYVHASDAEIEGISCLEAMACGRVPVISDSKLSATHQYALCPESRFRAGDAKDLTDKIDYWLAHPEERERFGALYAAAQDNNRVDLCARRTLELYETVIREHRSEQPVKREIDRRILTPNPEALSSKLTSGNALTRGVRNLFEMLITMILAVFCRFTLGLRVRGWRNLLAARGDDALPPNGGAVVVCNHVHHLDCAMAKCAFWWKKLWIVSMNENFNIPLVGGLIKQLGALPLGTDPVEQKMLFQSLSERLQGGDTALFYPEGMLVPYHEDIRPFFDGAFALSAHTQCPVVPLVLTQREGRWLFRFKRKPCFTLRILKPEYPNPELPMRAMRKELKERVYTEMCAAVNKNGPFDISAESELYVS